MRRQSSGLSPAVLYILVIVCVGLLAFLNYKRLDPIFSLMTLVAFIGFLLVTPRSHRTT